MKDESEGTGGVSTAAASVAGVSDAGVRRVLGMVFRNTPCKNGASALTLPLLYRIRGLVSKFGAANFGKDAGMGEKNGE